MLIALTTSAAATAATELTIEEIIAISRDNGIESFREVERDDAHWEVEGRDVDGRQIELDIDARTGEILEIDRD